MHSEIIHAKNKLYDLIDLVCSNIQEGAEGSEYAAATFQLNDKNILFRVANSTPTKTGQFVSIWKRTQEGITASFESSDAFDFIIIVTRKEHDVGQFIFSKSVLLDKGIISEPNKEGKRGIRLYPPWDKAENKQAQKTQLWQLDFFIDYSLGKEIDREFLKQLFL
jgi:hypothetical protein